MLAKQADLRRHWVHSTSFAKVLNGAGGIASSVAWPRASKPQNAVRGLAEAALGGTRGCG
jgi:hypothetical protein